MENRKCKKCNYELSDDAKFCLSCGEINSLETAADAIDRCSFCGGEKKVLQPVCRHCARRMKGVESSPTIKELSEKLEKAETESRKITILESFPIPNTKDEIMEFALWAASCFDNDYYVSHLDVEDISDAWLAKLKQCYHKVKVSFVGDAELKYVEGLYNSVIQKIEESKKEGQEKNRIQNEKEKSRTLFTGIIKIVLPIVLAVVVAISAYMIYLSSRGAINGDSNAIAIGWDYDEIIGQRYTDAVESLNRKGFSNIDVVDDGWHSGIESGVITDITIDGKRSFYSISKVDREAKIVIYYSSDPKLININISSNDLLGQNYVDVRDLLLSKGFSNIECREDGWNIFHKSKTVKSVLIDGLDEFGADKSFYENVTIVILYYK